MWMSAVLFFVALLLLLTFFLISLQYSTNGRKYWISRNVPCREPCPIFGNFGPTFMMRRSYASMLEYFYDCYRNEKYVGIFQARRPTLMLIDLDIVKNVFCTSFSNFSDRVCVGTDCKREPLLRNVTNMSGEEWRAMRQIITPFFSSAKIKAMFPLIADCAQSLKKILDVMPTDEVDVPQLMSRYSTDVIGSCFFGVNPGSLQNPDSPFIKMALKMFRMDRVTMLKRYCRVFIPRLFRLLNFRTYSPDVELFFTSIIKQVLEERRMGVRRNDFLQLMLNVQNTECKIEVTDELIISNSFIFMLAGLEQCATTLSFCLYELTKNKELQDKIRKEIVDCIERHGELNYEAATSMRFTMQAVIETLRLHPASPLTTRVCTSPCTLNGTDLKFEKYDPVLIPLQCIQKNPLYFPNPEEFNPDRFQDDLNPPGFLTFGDGPRSCIGARLAQLIVVAGLAAVLSSFSIEPCARTTSSIQYDARSVMLKNKGGIWLAFKLISNYKD